MDGDDDDEDEEREIGSIWSVAAVEAGHEEDKEDLGCRACGAVEVQQSIGEVDVNEKDMVEVFIKNYREEVRKYAEEQGIAMRQAAEELIEGFVLTETESGLKAEAAQEKEGWRKAKCGRKRAKKKTRFLEPTCCLQCVDEKKVAELATSKQGAEVGVEADEQHYDAFIGQVTGQRKWSSLGRGEITVDSAAEESVCPKGWGGAYELKPVTGKKIRFKNASGGEMGHFGSKEVKFRTKPGEGPDIVMSMGFEVSEVQKPLAAVWRIAEKGNLVQFGPGKDDNFIKNAVTGEKIMMKRKGKSYVLDVEFVVDKEEAAKGFQRQD